MAFIGDIQGVGTAWPYEQQAVNITPAFVGVTFIICAAIA